MLMDVLEPAAPALPVGAYEDPLDEDRVDDQAVRTTRRGLIRIALVAAETATRFQREAVACEPVAWMMASRDVFGGRSALEACLERDGCMRAVLLHGLSLGLDADADEIDGLLGDTEGGDVDVDVDVGEGDDLSDGRMPDPEASPPDVAGQGTGGPRLWTSFLVDETGTGHVHGFEALLAEDRAAAAALLRRRCGGDAGSFELFEGFDPGQPMAEALVSPAIADMLLQVAEQPGSILAQGLSVSIRQSFAG